MRRGVPVAWILASLLALVLLLPIVATYLARFDENRLIRQTEEALLVEAVLVGESYRALLTPAASLAPANGEPFRPLAAALDLRRSPVLPAVERGAVTATTSSVGAILDGVLERAQVRTLSGLRVLDTRGVVIASPTREHGYSLASLPEVSAALAGRYAPALRQRHSDSPAPLSGAERASDIRVSLAWPIFADPRATSGEVIGVVYAARTPLDLGRSWWRVRDALVVPVLLSLSGLLLVLAFLVRVIARPLAEITRAARRIAEGQVDAPLEPRGAAPAEIHQLGDALRSMRDQLERRAEYVRVFAAQAVHELKTPITSIRGAAELLAEHPDMAPEQRARFAGNVLEDALRMDRLVGRLLELARIESQQPRRSLAELRPWVEAVTERYGRRGHAIALECPAPLAPIEADLEQLDSALGNLIDNALRHGAGTPVRVRLTELGGAVELAVIDDGPKLEAGHFDRVFERFYTTERQHGGTGLGLAIVRAVAEAHGGSARARAREEGGAELVIRLPRG